MKVTQFCFGLLFILFASCMDSDPVAFSDLDELSSEARSFFGMRGESAKSMEAGGNRIINQSFKTTMRSLGGDMGGSIGLAGDSSITADPLPWESCATITQTENPDGSTTYTTDYGKGCLEGYGDYKYLMFGKYSYDWKYNETRQGTVVSYAYFSRSRTENYGGEYYYDGDTSKWISNGRSTYSGQSKYDTAKQIFSGSYSYSDTSQYTYDGITYNFKSSGKSFYDDKKSVTSANAYEYRSSLEFYRSTVLSPLVSDYSCTTYMPAVKADVRMMWWPSYVSGRERIEYERDGKAGKFEIDYGDGECDAIIFIYENGKVFRIDLNKDYEYFNKG